MQTNINNCIECPSHEIFPDPDPNDWFCDDDIKVVCKIENRSITVGCRPYNIEKECLTPKWCPKKDIIVKKVYKKKDKLNKVEDKINERLSIIMDR